MAKNWSESFLKLHISEKGRHRSESKTFGLYKAEYGFGMSEDIIKALMLTCETCNPGKAANATKQIKLSISADRKEAAQAFSWKPTLTQDLSALLGIVANKDNSEQSLLARVLFFDYFVLELFVMDKTHRNSVSAFALDMLYDQICKNAQYNGKIVPDMAITPMCRMSTLVNTARVEVVASEGTSRQGYYYWGLKPRDADAMKVLKDLQRCLGSTHQVLKTRKA